MNELDAVFGALADPTRRAVFQRLLDDGPASATSLAPEFPMSRQGLAKHLSVLGEAGLVTSERDGKQVRYEAKTEPLVDAASWLADTGAAWDRKLAKLSKLLG